MTDTQAELRDALARELCLIDHNGDEDAWAREGLPAQRGYNMMAKAAMSMLLPPAPAVVEALREAKRLLEIGPSEDWLDNGATNEEAAVRKIDEALAALGEGGA